MSDRRQFLTRVVAAGGALALCGARVNDAPAITSRRLRLLILGGTGNIGPYHVRAACARGHRVAVFSRGRAHAELPATVEHLAGDRNDDLDSIKGRDWDAVLDIATFGPGWIRSLGGALEGHLGHYTFISTISVYDHPEANQITDETSRVLRYRGSTDPYTVTSEGPQYGELKVLCEQEAERQFPGRTLILRPGYIGGPDDTHGVLPYWPVRMRKPGEVLAAGNPTTAVQFIDVRDMAEWAIRMIEARATGIYNVIGPATATDIGQVVEVARKRAPSSREVTWVPGSWLMSQPHGESWGTLLFWEFNKGYLTRMSNARALAHGLTTRPLRVTLSDTLQWYEKQPADKQATIVAGHRPKADHSGFESVLMPWSEYLEREKQTLALWHAQQPKST